MRSYRLTFGPEYVFVGIHKGARLLAEGVDCQLTATGITFAEPPRTTVDCYAESASILSASASTTCSRKPGARTAPPRCGGAASRSLVLTDARGHLYWHVCQELIGVLAEFNDRDKIIGGQVVQIRELVIRYQIPQVVVEVNGPGSFVGKLLRQALKGTGCGVREVTITNRQKRILDAFEAPLLPCFLWAHSDVLDGSAYDQMRVFNPVVTNQPDDFSDSGTGANSETPVRIGENWSENRPAQGREDWQSSDGDHEVAVDYSPSYIQT